MPPITTNEGKWVEFPWSPMSAGPFLFDVETGVEQCGGTDFLFDDYATVRVTECGVYINNHNESNLCNRFFINKYGEMFGVQEGFYDTCLQRAIDVLKCASIQKGASLERIEHNIAVLEDLQQGKTPAGAGYVQGKGFNLTHSVVLEDKPWPKEDTILCKEGDESNDCTYYMSPTGAIRVWGGLYGTNAFKVVLAYVNELTEEDAGDRYVAGLKTFLSSVRREKGVLPEPQY